MNNAISVEDDRQTAGMMNHCTGKGVIIIIIRTEIQTKWKKERKRYGHMMMMMIDGNGC